mgnify:CR=1 FL=1
MIRDDFRVEPADWATDLDALRRGLTAAQAAKTRLEQSSAAELAAEELRLAQQALSEITGEFSNDDLLGRVFSQFCIGK